MFNDYLFLLIGCSQEPVIKRGEELLRKKANSTNLDDPNLINKLFLLFNGMKKLLFSLLFLFKWLDSGELEYHFEK